MYINRHNIPITNKKGIIAVNGCPEKTIMAHPIELEDELDKGYVGIKNYKTNLYIVNTFVESPSIDTSTGSIKIPPSRFNNPKELVIP